MAVGANTYGTVARVETLVGDLVASRTFTTGTVPTIAQVETFLDDVANEINAYLSMNQYTMPVSATTDAQARGIVTSANCYGAAALVLAMLPTEISIMPNGQALDIGKSRRSFFESKYKEILKSIIDHKFPATRSLDALEVFAGSEEDSDGNTKLPIFTRSVTDYPGSRSLVDE